MTWSIMDMAKLADRCKPRSSLLGIDRTAVSASNSRPTKRLSLRTWLIRWPMPAVAMPDGTPQHEEISTLLGRFSVIYEMEHHDELHSEFVRGQGGIRTPSGHSHLIYSQAPSAIWVPTRALSGIRTRNILLLREATLPIGLRARVLRRSALGEIRTPT